MHSTVTFEEVELLARICLYIADTIFIVVVNVMKMKISSALSLGNKRHGIVFIVHGEQDELLPDIASSRTSVDKCC